jgi:hypothetical protein
MLMNQMRISTNQVSSVMLRSKKLEIKKKKKCKNCVSQYCANFFVFVDTFFASVDV